MISRVRYFLAQPQEVDEDFLRVAAAALLAAGGIFFFRQRALPELLACAAGGGVVLAALWAGFHRLGLRPLGELWPGRARAAGVTLLVFCLLPPGIPLLLAAFLGGLAVAIEGLQKKALVPLALGGVMLAWLAATLWQTRAGAPYIAPIDFHALDEPITLWVRFRAGVDPVRSYAGQVAGPLGATSFGLAALGTLLLSYARAVSWPLLLSFYAPVLVMTLLGRRPLPVYLINGPALVLVGLIAATPRRLPAERSWQAGMGLLGGVVAAVLLWRGAGALAFGLGVVVSSAVVGVFQFLGLAGSPGVMERRAEARRQRAPSAPRKGMSEAERRATALQVAALTVFLPVGLGLIWIDGSLRRPHRTALVGAGVVLYVALLAASLAWFWVLRLPA